MNKKQQRRESHSGFHFYDLYNCCKRKFFIKYALRLLPKYTAHQLIQGSAFHEGKATFYNTKSKKKGLTRAKKEITDRKLEFFSDEEYNFVKDRVPILLSRWIDTFGFSDLEEYELVAVEEEIVIKMEGLNGHPVFITLRPDAIVRQKGTNRYFVLETKTSSFSIRLASEGVELGDQATTYYWGAMEKYQIEPYGVIPDIAYWNKGAKTEDNIQIVRGDIVRRRKEDILSFKLGFLQTMNEISQKMEAWQSGLFPPDQLFPRNTYYCTAFMKPCEYVSVCRTSSLSLRGRPPAGFRRENKRSIRIDSFIEDSAMGLT